MRQLSAGDLLADRYALTAKLGEGAVADVWLAQDTESNYRVALKFLRAPDGPVPSVEQFRSEWQTLRALNHPHIVRAFDFHESPSPFYAQYYVDGIALSDLGRQDWQIVLRPLLLICRAVSYLHQRDVCHGDLVARNILIDRGGAPFLIDFGSARRGDISVGCSGGTPAAMSPERLAGGGQPSSADDVYALAVLITEIVTGAAGKSALARLDTWDDVPGKLTRLLASMHGNERERPGIAAVEAELLSIGLQPGPLPAALVRDCAGAAMRSRQPEAAQAEPIAAVARPAKARTATAAAAPAPGRKTGVSATLVWSALALLLALVVWVFAYLPRQLADSRSDQPTASTLGLDETEAPGPGDVTGESMAARPAVERTEAVRLKNTTDRILGELLTKQEVLEKRAVARWAAARYESALERYAEGDRYYLAQNYTEAAVAYRDTIAVFDLLLGEVDNTFEQYRDRATAALESGNSREAEKLFDLALAISPNDPRSRAGLSRARQLDEVLLLTDAALDAESSGDFDAALAGFDQALALDSEWAAAALGRKRVVGLIAEQKFRQLMTSGFDALNAGRLEQAERAFREARQFRPGSSEPLDGLQQVDQAMKLETIERLTASARRAEIEEDWQGAAERYESALKQDANLVVAQEGLRRAQSRIALDQQLEKYIADPDSLAESAVLNSAAGLLTRIAKISPHGPRLDRQKTELARLLKRAANPIEVQLISDTLTDVAVYKVGRLGRFETTELELRPGVYTAVGTRPGYKDVRLEFRVAPEIEMNPIVVRCEEPI